MRAVRYEEFVGPPVLAEVEAPTPDARGVVVDVNPASLATAAALGAAPVVAGSESAARIREITPGGAYISIDAFGSAGTLRDAVLSLRPRGRHVQVGLLLDDDADPAVPMGRVIADELVILGSHGIAVSEYEATLRDIAEGRLTPGDAVGRVIAFDDIPEALESMDQPRTAAGMTVARIGVPLREGL